MPRRAQTPRRAPRLRLPPGRMRWMSCGPWWERPESTVWARQAQIPFIPFTPQRKFDEDSCRNAGFWTVTSTNLCTEVFKLVQTESTCVVKMTAPMPLLRTENFVLEFRFVQLGKNFTDIPLPVENTGHKLRYWCLFMIPVWIYRSEIPVIYRERKISPISNYRSKILVINCGILVFFMIPV